MPTKCEGRGPGQPCTLGKGGQPRQPTYAAPGSNKPTRCATCRVGFEGYHDVRSRRCEGTVAPSASPEEAAHAARIPCTHGKNGAPGRPCYAPPGSDKPMRCVHCKLPGWHNTRKVPTCEGPAPGQPCTHGQGGRPAWPSFAAPGERTPRRCARCVPDRRGRAPWPNVRSYPQCEGRGDGKPCTNGAGGRPARSSWTAPGGVKATRCAHCRGPDFVSRRSKTLCEGDVEAGKPCKNSANGGPCRPSFAAPGKTKPTRCSACRKEGWRSVASRAYKSPDGCIPVIPVVPGASGAVLPPGVPTDYNRRGARSSARGGSGSAAVAAPAPATAVAAAAAAGTKRDAPEDDGARAKRARK